MKLLIEVLIEIIRRSLKGLLTVFICVFFTACAEDRSEVTCTGKEAVEASDGRGTVLVIGDSISIGYTPHLKDALGDTYQVTHNPCNAMTSTWTRMHVEKWLASRTSFEVIVWNNGLWDIATWISTGDAAYEANLRAIARAVRAKTAKPLFILTTKVPVGTPYRNDSDVVRINAIAQRVMSEEGIPVLDLYAVSANAEHSAPADVHYTTAGSAVLGDAILNELNQTYGVN